MTEMFIWIIIFLLIFICFADIFLGDILNFPKTYGGTLWFSAIIYIICIIFIFDWMSNYLTYEYTIFHYLAFFSFGYLIGLSLCGVNMNRDKWIQRKECEILEIKEEIKKEISIHSLNSINKKFKIERSRN